MSAIRADMKCDDCDWRAAGVPWTQYMYRPCPACGASYILDAEECKFMATMQDLADAGLVRMGPFSEEDMEAAPIVVRIDTAKFA